MAETKRKGDVGEAMVMADILRRGHKVAMPVGEDWKYDLIALRNGTLERVQCKYTESDGQTILVNCRSVNAKVKHHYTSKDIDWLAAYDKTTDRCYYIPASMLGEGMSFVVLRITPSKNNQSKKVNWARDFVAF